MLADEQRRQGAADIYRTEQEKKVIPQLGKTLPAIGLQDAYAIQQLWAEMHFAKGARQIGHKIGRTSRAMQMASKIAEPDYGHLLDSMVYGDGARAVCARFKRREI